MRSRSFFLQNANNHLQNCALFAFYWLVECGNLCRFFVKLFAKTVVTAKTGERKKWIDKRTEAIYNVYKVKEDASPIKLL